ncbi:YggT family protein [Noviherbaspirillum pedocola]|uniref:YggT family protein n=1 Tax=Noviherbaspirillum pedocola TaxID=2801341 RepID=A0A934SN28_9BURK|nr:YggT family protein [Noviherbaspirillum pedocola]MBK4733485.1 YggT family protein [Noviherbaspirillum pedocola]
MLYSIVGLIVDTVAVLLGGIMLLRFWMQAVRVRPPYSLGHFMYQLSDWLVQPLRKLIPGRGGYDWASLIGTYLVALAAMAIELALMMGLNIQMLLVLSLVRVLQWAVYGFMGLLLIEVIFSWVNPQAPLAPVVRALNEPLMRPLRRIIPPLGGIDLSPLVAFILLQIALRLIGAILLPLA